MRKALIACGGTGGHLSPGIALAEELNARGWKCELLISNKQVDSRLVKKYSKFDYARVPGSGFSLSPIQFMKFTYNLTAGLMKCVKEIRRTKPDVVVGFGGFLSSSALFAGHLCQLPVAIHEANRIPGRATRFTSWFVNRLYLPRGVKIKSKRSSRIRYVGMPVRREISLRSKSTAKESLGFDPNKKLLMVMGGSQGARALTEWARDNFEALAKRGIQVYCLTGMAVEGDSEIKAPDNDGEDVKAMFHRFSDDMSLALSAADLVVSRSGAGSISEFARCRVPSILVPFPFAADNHQYFNARYFEMQGGGIVVEQSKLDELFGESVELIYNEWLLGRLKSNLEKIDALEPQQEMAEDLEALAGANGKGSDSSELDGKEASGQ